VSESTTEGPRRTAPYGTWPSEVSSDLLANGALAFAELAADQDSIYWLETRPKEGGRSVLMRWFGDRVSDLIPAPFSARSRVHEYGGASTLVREGQGWFVNDADQCVYAIGPKPVAITHTDGSVRFGDLDHDGVRNRLLAVCEDHRTADHAPANYIAAIDIGSSAVEPIASGCDFYLAPRVSPDGTMLAWIQWNHPNLPWDSTQLLVAPLQSDGSVGKARVVAGNGHESVCHPCWNERGKLLFISDRSGWWNVYAWNGSSVDPVLTLAADIGMAYAMGRSSLGVSGDRVVASVRRDGLASLVEVNLEGGVPTPLDTGVAESDFPRLTRNGVAFIGGSADVPASVWRYDFATARCDLIRGAGVELDNLYLGRPEILTIPAPDGGQIHAFYYSPRSPHFMGPADQLPPLIVMAHGGPTYCASTCLQFGRYAVATEPVFWTSRGYAYLAVNYRGSTGFGREYRRALEGRWGELDVEDCIAAARYLVNKGLVDGRRIVIRGPSAGGFTVLAALASTRFFAAGAAYFPVTDLVGFASVTHKYESRYLDTLIGAFDEDVYKARSPISQVARIETPVIILQGLRDAVTPPAPVTAMVEAIRKRGGDVEYVAFEDEGHGFGWASSIVRSLDAEAAFYDRILR
jgi:dipeptidyl aminopeptidase/acylaminoacyl peptidase